MQVYPVGNCTKKLFNRVMLPKSLGSERLDRQNIVKYAKENGLNIRVAEMEDGFICAVNAETKFKKAQFKNPGKAVAKGFSFKSLGKSIKNSVSKLLFIENSQKEIRKNSFSPVGVSVCPKNGNIVDLIDEARFYFECNHYEKTGACHK